MIPLDMNVKIAEILGLDVEITGTEKVCTAFITNHKGRHPAYVIDYTTDKALCWDLMEKLLQAGWEPWYFDKIYKWRKYDAVKHKDIIIYDKDLLLATCEAFIEEFSVCNHEWVPVDNEVCSGGMICLKCGRIKGND